MDGMWSVMNTLHRNKIAHRPFYEKEAVITECKVFFPVTAQCLNLIVNQSQSHSYLNPFLQNIFQVVVNGVQLYKNVTLPSYRKIETRIEHVSSHLQPSRSFKALRPVPLIINFF